MSKENIFQRFIKWVTPQESYTITDMQADDEVSRAIARVFNNDPEAIVKYYTNQRLREAWERTCASQMTPEQKNKAIAFLGTKTLEEQNSLLNLATTAMADAESRGK